MSQMLQSRRLLLGLALAAASWLVAGVACAQPLPPQSSNGVVNLIWDRSPDAVGYRVYVALTNSGWTSYLVGNADSVSLGQLTIGSFYKSQVTALDSAGMESLPSNEVRFMATAATAQSIPTTIRIYSFMIESAGVTGKTNAIQESQSLTAAVWNDALVFLGDGSTKGFLRTNTGGSRFYRTIIK